jgi:hypothetical protein
MAMRSASSASVTRRMAGCGSFLVDVPLVEMFDRAGVHGDQRRMNDRAGIHQRARQRIAAWLDGASETQPRSRQRMRGEA